MRRGDPKAWAEHLAKSQHVRIAAATPFNPLEPAAVPRSGRPLRVGRMSGQLQGVPLLVWQLEMAGAPVPEQEYRFHETRGWRADLAWPARRLLVEYEGAVHLNGRHVRGEGYENDCEKYNAAVMSGFFLLRFTDRTVRNGTALANILEMLNVLAGVPDR